MPRQTIQRAAELVGTGLHTGAPGRLRLLPAPAGTGIAFVRADLGSRTRIPATAASVVDSERRTTLAAGADRVETVEHLLAALAARQIDDLLVELEGPEVPIMDGSFLPFWSLLEAAGLSASGGRPRVWRARETFVVSEAATEYVIGPAPGLELEVTLEYTEPVIGTQSAIYRGGAAAFAAEIAPARTYGFRSEIERLRARGLLAGARTESAIVVSEHAPLNTALRWPNEFARHKLGDLLGDLALLGGRLAASVRARRPSHRGNLACVRAIAARVRIEEEA